MRTLQPDNRVRAGALAIAIVVLVVGVGQSFSSLPVLFATASYYAQFTDSAGVSKGDKVRIVGVDVGTVQDMSIDGDHILMKFTTGTRDKVLAQIRTLKGDEWGPYNSAARYLLGAGLEPALAMQLADRSIHLKETWNNVWTKAQLLHAAGKTSEALAAAQRAQTLGKASTNFFEADEVAKALVSWKK